VLHRDITNISKVALRIGHQRVKGREAILNPPGGGLHSQNFRPLTSSESKPHGLPRIDKDEGVLMMPRRIDDDDDDDDDDENIGSHVTGPCRRSVKWAEGPFIKNTYTFLSFPHCTSPKFFQKPLITLGPN